MNKTKFRSSKISYTKGENGKVPNYSTMGYQKIQERHWGEMKKKIHEAEKLAGGRGGSYGQREKLSSGARGGFLESWSDHVLGSTKCSSTFPVPGKPTEKY